MLGRRRQGAAREGGGVTRKAGQAAAAAAAAKPDVLCEQHAGVRVGVEEHAGRAIFGSAPFKSSVDQLVWGIGLARWLQGGLSWASCSPVHDGRGKERWGGRPARPMFALSCFVTRIGSGQGEPCSMLWA